MDSTASVEENQVSTHDDSESKDKTLEDIKQQQDGANLSERLSEPLESQNELKTVEVPETNSNKDTDSNPTIIECVIDDSHNIEEPESNNVDVVSNTETVTEDSTSIKPEEIDPQISESKPSEHNVELEESAKSNINKEVGDTINAEAIPMEVEPTVSDSVDASSSDTPKEEVGDTINAEAIPMEVEPTVSDSVDASSSDTPKDASSSDTPKDASSSDTPKDASSSDTPKDAATEVSESETSQIIAENDTSDILNKDEEDSTKSEKADDDTNTETVTPMEITDDTKNDETPISNDDETKTRSTNEIEGENSSENEKNLAHIENSLQGCNNVEQDNSEEGENENTVFVHVDTENEKDDGDKNATETNTQEIQDEEDFQNSQPQEDPIASDDFAPIPMEEETEYTEQGIDEEQGSSEELCIIPDTERVISQEEKDAAAAMVPLRDPSDSDGIFNATSTDDTTKELSLEEPKDSATGKYIVSTCTDENVNSCMQCCLPRKSKYSVLNNKKTSYICDDSCLNSFKERHGDKVVHNSEGDLRVKKLTSGVNNDNMVAKVIFLRKCMECEKKIINDEVNLSWETMEFCNEFCLSKYQKRIGSNCANCQAEVRSNCLGKYCVRFGYDIRQFCSSVCLEEYKKGLKVCSYCQKDMSGGGDGFLAPVGDKGQFKDFCTQQCMEKYDIMSNNRTEQPVSKAGNTCSVCLNEKPITIEFEHDNKMNLFCGEPCFVAFKFVNNITPGKCDMCRKYFDNKILEEHSMYYDNAQHSFCSKSCQNIYIIAHRRIVPCSWCKVKKYNFDMIKRNFSSGPVLMMCSLNCLSLYQVSVNAVNSKKIKCDHCHKSLQPLYHLTMSDATIRNFCSYMCVMAFQNQFPKTPITLNEPEEAATPVPTGGPKRSKRVSAKNLESVGIPADVPTIPVISSVQSLATTNGPTSATTRITRAKNNADASINVNSSPAMIKTQIKQQYIIKSTPPPPQRNVSTLCKVITASKGISHKPQLANKEVQTDEIQDKTAVIPVPVPLFVPSPMWMYSMPFPVPFPFPLPVPVPIFIPTTRNSASGIMKEIKKIQVKIPTDPFEAELLMMAEMVAGDKKEEHTESESDEEDNAGGAADEGTFSPEPVDASNTFGDDMLQMALKMATELDEPAVDLEGALTASTITASQGGEAPAGGEVSVDDPQPLHHMMERQAIRGRKRPGRPPRSASSKRGRRSSSQMEIPLMAPPQPPAPPEPVEKPDANMCLKFTFGVNAWKQWVTTKNAELEKSTRRVKLFKPEILQLTADELNYSLCLFVKEVRKPNGQEYAPDTIYYLCLGIQQYLFENGRIDNIFCDTYYEKFTDCLDDVAKKFSILYNDSHYIVTRVEEEHLWESKQLGAHSPHVLLSTLMFFNTKHFNLTTVDEHMQLSFSHIMKHWKRNPNQPGTNKVAGSRNVLLRFYPPQSNTETSQRKKKVYEQQENEENPLRCPVKLYEFYLSKCPESVKTRNDVFYLLPERSCVPDSPVWYSTMPLPRNALEKMLHRVKMVKEINVALLTS